MSKVDWSLAPVDATHYLPDSDMDYECWVKPCFSMRLDTQKEWHADTAVDADISSGKAIPRQPKPWSGPEDGLPPVGIACERRFPSVTASSWQGGIILAHGSKKIFFRDNCGDEWAHSFDDVEFRAIKTPEQIAADQRETAIRELMDIAQVDCRVTAARLVDAGFKREVV